MDEFQRQCFEKVNDKQVEFGPHQLEAGGCYIICLDVVMASQYGNEITQSATVTASIVLQQYNAHARNGMHR